MLDIPTDRPSSATARLPPAESAQVRSYSCSSMRSTVRIETVSVELKAFLISFVCSNNEGSGRLIIGSGALLDPREGTCNGYSFRRSGCGGCSSLRKRRQCNEHASESDNCFLNHDASLLLVMIPKVRRSKTCWTLQRCGDLTKNSYLTD